MANPITVAEAQTHLRLGTLDASETAELEMLIGAATEYAESVCNRPWASTTRKLYFDEFPVDCFRLHGEVAEADGGLVCQVNYHDTSNIHTPFIHIRVVTKGGRSFVYPAYGHSWPTDGSGEPFSVEVEYVGATVDTTPASVKSAILLLVGDLYENRENSVTERGVTVSVKVSLTAERLLTPYKTRAA